MSTRIAVDFHDIPETLLLPLWGRAELTRQGYTIVRDEAAVDIIDSLDYDFSRLRADLDFSKNLSWSARARQFDDKIREFLLAHHEGLVVNLGAGLDTTFLRVDNGHMRWIDLDLPEVIEVRTQLIVTRERTQNISSSLFDTAWMESIDSGNGLMFVAGGLLFYFEEAEVAELLRFMVGRFTEADLVFDAMTPAGISRANEMMKNVGMEDARLHWGVTDAKVLESTIPGLRVVEQFEYFRGLNLEGIPNDALKMIEANRLLRVMTIVHCRWGS